MSLKLPAEILHLIFTQSSISTEDLTQLQLTCKQWNPIAQQHLYKEIHLNEPNLYRNSGNSRDKVTKRIQLLMQTLLQCDIQIGKYVKIIHVDPILQLEDPMSKFVALVGLCPNITALHGATLSADFYKSLPNLHHRGYLQDLQFITSPNDNKREDNMSMMSSYFKAIVAFRNTLKRITIADGVGRTVMADDSISPDYLQQFSRLEHLQLEEFSRFNLYRMSDYLSKCCSNIKSINIRMHSEQTTPTPVMDEYNDQSLITPQNQVQKLKIELALAPLTTNEMLFIMRMFPSLDDFSVEFFEDEEITTYIQHDTDVAARFLDYLYLIPDVEYAQMWFGVSEGLVLLSRLSKSIKIQKLDIASIDEEDLSAVAISLYRSPPAPSVRLGIAVYSNDPTNSLRNAMETLKCESVQYLTVVIEYDYQKLTEDLQDFIIERFTSLQELTFEDTEFPAEVQNLKGFTLKDLRHLCLSSCKIPQDCFMKLSYQLEHVDTIEYSTDSEDEGERQVQIYLPHTTVGTLDLLVKACTSFAIKVWADRKCVNLNVGENMANARNIIIYCNSLKKLCINHTTLRL